MGIGVAEKRNKLHLQLTREETYRLECAQTQGYVTIDGRDDFDPVIAAYPAWCRTTRHPFLHIALGVTTAKVIFSLLEADSSLRPKTEQQLRQRIPTYCLSHAEIEIEPDYLIAGRVVNDLLLELRDWLLELSNQVIYRIHERSRRRK